MSNTLWLILHRTVECHHDVIKFSYTQFAKSFIFHNPVWDFGLQFSLVRLNKYNAYHFDREDFSTYTSTCICPCSSIFKRWHKKYELNNLPNFNLCEHKVYHNIFDFVQHVQDRKKSCDYHYMVMCAVQSNYSALIANHKFSNSKKYIASKFGDIHKEKVRLTTFTKFNVKLTYIELFR